MFKEFNLVHLKLGLILSFFSSIKGTGCDGSSSHYNHFLIDLPWKRASSRADDSCEGGDRRHCRDQE